MTKNKIKKHFFIKNRDIVLPHTNIGVVGRYECYPNVSEIRNIMLKLTDLNIMSQVYNIMMCGYEPNMVSFTDTNGYTHNMVFNEFLCRLQVTTNETICGYEGNRLYGQGQEVPFRMKGDTYKKLEIDLSHPAHNNNTMDGYHGISDYHPTLNLSVSLKNNYGVDF